ncbi:unnamed protein product, partial [Rotaria sp. Silwood2]
PSFSQPFYLIFIELLNKTYYIFVIQKTYKISTTITKIINPSDHSQHINELFNEIFVKIQLIRHIKYNHLPYENNSRNIFCFYDNNHICLCYDNEQKCLVNCFDFNHNINFDCFGQNVCENEG